MISLKQLKYTLAVAEQLHFKRAADQCSISQSALSTAITDMERQLGFPVFERDNKKVLVTPLGDQFLEKARAIYVQMQDLESLGSSLSAPLSGPLSIGLIPTIAPFLLPKLLQGLSEDYPALELRVEEDQSQHLVEKVQAGLLDTAILALPYDCKGLLSFPFLEEVFYLVHRVEQSVSRSKSVTSEDMEGARLMLLRDGHCLKDHALAACKLEQSAAFSIGGTSLNTLIQLVIGGLGTTLVPAMALPQLVAPYSELRATPLAESGPHRRIAFIVRPNYPGLANIETLKKRLSDMH